MSATFILHNNNSETLLTKWLKNNYPKNNLSDLFFFWSNKFVDYSISVGN